MSLLESIFQAKHYSFSKILSFALLLLLFSSCSSFVATIGFLCTAIAYSLYVTAQKGVKAQTAGIISGMETVYGIVFALIFLREIPTVRELVGGAVILGIAFYSSLHSED